MDASAATERWEPDLSQVRLEDLPEGFREVAERIGLRAALQLVAVRGGQRLLVPARPRAGGVLEQLGHDACAKLCAHYGGARLYVPTESEVARKARDRAIRSAHFRQGESAAALARRYGTTERRIQQIIAQGMRVQEVTGQ